jgi:hypothetical protein
MDGLLGFASDAGLALEVGLAGYGAAAVVARNVAAWKAI